MAYKVCIVSGRGKNRAKACSIPLPNKQRVANYLKRTPIGNDNTKVSVKNLRTGKMFTGRKIRFYNPKRW